MSFSFFRRAEGDPQRFAAALLKLVAGIVGRCIDQT